MKYLLLALLMIATPASAVDVTNASGTVDHGSSLVITGTAFGTKSTAAPIIYDDFENGTGGTQLTTAKGWTEVGYAGVQKPEYAADKKHSGNLSMKLLWNNGEYASSVRKNADFSTAFYLDGWFQYQQEPSAPWSRVVKLAVLFGSSGIQYPQIHIGTANCTQDEAFHVAGYANANTAAGNVYVFSLGDLIGKFNHIQVWVKASDSDVANGKLRVWFNGHLIASSDTYLTVAGNEGYWNHVRVGYYHAHDGIPDFCDPSPGDAYGWWDDVYLDNTQARVEIGNNAIYANCTHREIQIPTAWGASSVTVTVNTGTFVADQAAYLYVVDADGNVNSAGYPITIGQSADNPVAVTAPTNLEATGGY